MRFDAREFGVRAKNLRASRGYSVAEMARLSGLSKNTVLRIEHGLPSTPRARQSVASVFNLFVEYIEQMASPYYMGEPLTMSALQRRWVVNTSVMTVKAPRDLDDLIQDENERRRLAQLGWITRFEALVIPQAGPDVPCSAILEVWSRLGFLRKHLGHETGFVLRGGLRILFQNRTLELYSGDGYSFAAEDPHDYEPIEPLGPGDEPPLVLYTVQSTEGKSPIKGSVAAREPIGFVRDGLLL